MGTRLMSFGLLMLLLATPAMAQTPSVQLAPTSPSKVSTRHFTFKGFQQGIYVFDGAVFGGANGAGVILPPVRFFCRHGWACRTASAAIGAMAGGYVGWALSKNGGF